ncbi:MAG: hypothetical protein EOO77_46245 [Oxalobacteraceae bacterium]|nr:MAG: hypothetical protein EOO77_46245 [Oxalobacteraceae bacterium]
MARFHEYDPDSPPEGTNVWIEVGKGKDKIPVMLNHLSEHASGDVWWGFTNPTIDVIVLVLVFSDPNEAFDFKMRYA